MQLMKINKQNPFIFRPISIILCIALLCPYVPAYSNVLPYMPPVNKMISTSSAFNMPYAVGIRFDKNNPLFINFILNSGSTKLTPSTTRKEMDNIMKYFLAAVTIPNKDLWVNLSPYEGNRVAPDALAITELGKNMLGEDYVLKQLSASLTYPESELGKKFWDKVYKKIFEKFGTTKLPVNAFSKIWVTPGEIVIYQEKNQATVAAARLKVMTEEDFFANKKGKNITTSKSSEVDKISSQVMREVILPVIEEEVNTGSQFAHLRQIYYSVILGQWFKEQLKSSILNDLYINKNKTPGSETEDKHIREKIYNAYIEAFKAGVYNYTRKENEINNNAKILKRTYVCGGMVMDTVTTRQIIPVTDEDEIAIPLTKVTKPGDKIVITEPGRWSIPTTPSRPQAPNNFINTEDETSPWEAALAQLPTSQEIIDEADAIVPIALTPKEDDALAMPESYFKDLYEKYLLDETTRNIRDTIHLSDEESAQVLAQADIAAQRYTAITSAIEQIAGINSGSAYPIVMSIMPILLFPLRSDRKIEAITKALEGYEKTRNLAQTITEAIITEDARPTPKNSDISELKEKPSKYTELDKRKIQLASRLGTTKGGPALREETKQRLRDSLSARTIAASGYASPKTIARIIDAYDTGSLGTAQTLISEAFAATEKTEATDNIIREILVYLASEVSTAKQAIQAQATAKEINGEDDLGGVDFNAKNIKIKGEEFEMSGQDALSWLANTNLKGLTYQILAVNLR